MAVFGNGDSPGAALLSNGRNPSGEIHWWLPEAQDNIFLWPLLSSWSHGTLSILYIFNRSHLPQLSFYLKIYRPCITAVVAQWESVCLACRWLIVQVLASKVYWHAGSDSFKGPWTSKRITRHNKCGTYLNHCSMSIHESALVVVGIWKKIIKSRKM